MKSLIYTYDANYKQLNIIISCWNLIPHNEDIDSLAEKVLKLLYEAAAPEHIKRVIESELTVTQGLFKTEFNAANLAQEIVSWWHE